jgi:hypothetical protein
VKTTLQNNAQKLQNINISWSVARSGMALFFHTQALAMDITASLRALYGAQVRLGDELGLPGMLSVDSLVLRVL